MPQRQQIGVLCITTGKYKQFFNQLYEGVKKYFLLNHDIKIFLFTDEFISYEIDDRVKIEQHLILSYKFPFATLYRYRIFAPHQHRLREMDFLLYLDIDMGIINEVTDEILVNGLMAVRHPGFFTNNGWGDSNNPSNSKSFLPTSMRKHYYCGGTQGGDSWSYLDACKIMSENITEDERNGVIAEWNDETHWNFLLHTTNMKVNEFSPSYCMPEPERLRQAWGLTELKPIISALDKDHKAIRE